MKHILLFILFIVAPVLKAQEAARQFKFTSMADFGSLEEGDLTGQLNASLPLYNIEMQNFKFPMELRYNQDGNVNANSEGGQFGEAWNLNLLGTVTRRPRAIEPVVSKVETLPQCEQYEYFAKVYDEFYYKQNSFVSDRNNNERDVFLFNVLGLSGKFLIKQDILTKKLVAVLLESSDYCKINVQTTETPKKMIESFEIIDKQGYRYILDTKNNVNDNYGYKVIYGPPVRANSSDKPYPYEIKLGSLNPAANNTATTERIVPVYISIPLNKNDFWEEMNLSRIYDKDGKLVLDIKYQTFTKNWIDGMFSFDMYNGNRSIRRFAIDSIILKDHGLLVFDNYQPEPSKMVTSKITVKDLKGNIIKSVGFEYDRVGANINQRMFSKQLLKKISDHNNTSKPLITELFYKKNISNVMDVDYDLGYVMRENYFNPIHMGLQHFASDLNALQKIKYPTGASVLYKFGPHTKVGGVGSSGNMDNQVFSTINSGTNTGQIYNFTVGDNDLVFILSLTQGSSNLVRIVNGVSQSMGSVSMGYTVNFTTGQARTVGMTDNVYNWPFIKKLEPGTYRLESSSTSTKYVIKSMKYKTGPDVKLFSYMPGLRIEKIAHYLTNVSQDLLETTDGSAAEKLVQFHYTLDGANTSSGKVLFDYRVYKGLYDFKNPLSPCFEPATFYTKVTTEVRGVGKKASFFGFTDGLTYMYKRLVKTETYDTQNNLLEEVNYDRTSARLTNYFSDTNYFIKDLRMLVGSYEQKTVETAKSYENGSYVQRNAETNYENTYRQVASVLSDDNAGYTTKTENDYEAKTNTLVVAQSRNYVNGSLVSQQLNTYNEVGSSIKTEFKTPEMPSYEKVGQENTKYISGLLVGYTQADGTPVTLAYGYNGTQVIAKIVNLDVNVFYSAANQALLTQLDNYSNPYHTAYSEAELKKALNTVRTSFPNAVVTGYTYKPMVGISSIMDENGRITTYEFDTYNRLSTVKDYQGNILKEYQYNFTN